MSLTNKFKLLANLNSLYWQLSKQLSSQLSEQVGIDFSEWLVLSALAKGETAQREIVKVTGFTPAGVTKIIDKLAQRNLLKRENAGNDRRQNQISITKLGQATSKQSDLVLAGILNLLTQESSSDQVDNANQLLAEIHKQLPLLTSQQ